MTIQSIVDHPALRWYRERPREGYTLATTPPEIAITGPTSRLGGFPFLRAMDAWPKCPVCGISLFFVGQLGSDLWPLVLPNGFDLLTIFKCCNSDCNNWAGEYRGADFFQLHSVAEFSSCAEPYSHWNYTEVYPPPQIEFDHFGPTNPSIFVEVGFPFSLRVNHSITDFPGWQEHDSWREIDDPVYDEYLEHFPVGGAKLYGHPNWEQGPAYPKCRCGGTMRHLLQLESPQIQLGDCGRMHVFHCEEWCCGAESLSASWQCG